MAPGSMRYWDVSTMALTPPSSGTLSCSTERELSRQAPRGRSVRQRLRRSSGHCVPMAGPHAARERGKEEEMGLEGTRPAEPKPAGSRRAHRSTMQSLRGCGAMLSVT